MPSPDQQLAPIDVARLEERRIAAALRDISLEYLEIAGGVVCYGGVGSWQNGGYGVGIEEDPSDEDLDRAEAFWTQRQAEPRFELSPFVSQAFLQRLAARGYLLRDFENLLYRVLEPGETIESPEPRADDGAPLEIRQIDPADEAEIALLARVATSGFLPPGEPLTDELLQTVARTARHPRTRSFIACFGGVPVAACGMELHDEVAALFGLSTLEPHRRRGIQLALIVHRLRLAQEHGCRAVTIGSKPGIPTERNAARVGFRVACTKVNMYRPGPGLIASL